VQDRNRKAAAQEKLNFAEKFVTNMRRFAAFAALAAGEPASAFATSIDTSGLPHGETTGRTLSCSRLVSSAELPCDLLLVMLCQGAGRAQDSV
jgi:hypothetical protein